MHCNFGCLITAIVTPFDESFSIDYHKLEELAEYLLNKGSDGLVIAGSTGESPTLSIEEKLNMYKILVNSFKGKLKIIAGTGGNSTRDTIELSMKAEEAGVDGLMLVVPYYNKPPQEGLYQHFKRISAAVSLPIMLYNVPGRTGVNLNAETTLRLAELENIVAIKEASGNIEQITSICAGAPEGFAVYSGDDAMTLPILSVGGTGVVSVASHLVGPELKKMMSCFFAGDVEQAIRIHQTLAPLFKALFVTTNPIPLKAAMNMAGLKVGECRPPLTPLPEELKGNLQKLIQDLKLLEQNEMKRKEKKRKEKKRKKENRLKNKVEGK